MSEQDANRFRQAETQYFILRGQLETGRLAREEFERRVQELMLTDAQGRYWALSPDTGRWHIYEQNAWRAAEPFAATPAAPPPPLPMPPPMPRGTVPSTPIDTAPPAALGQFAPSPVQAAPPTPAAAPPSTAIQPAAPPRTAPAPQGGGWGCGRIFACGCATALLLLIVCGVGGYWGFTSGTITLPAVLRLVGMGPATIEVDNFRDDRIDVTLRQLDTSGDSPGMEGALQLNAFDVKSLNTPQAGRFRVTFAVSGSRLNLGACTLTLRSGDLYQFVVLPERLVVNRVNNPVNVARDLLVDTSALCR